jgi:uncharacterized protein (DUF1800 family)
MPEKTVRWMHIGLAGLMAGLAVLGCSSSQTAPSTTTAAPQVEVIVTGAAQVRLGANVQLYVAVANTTNTSVTWQVNGVAGGSATTGTISSSGLYTPPTTLPGTNPVTITAVSAAAPTVSGSLSETVQNPIPAVTSATANTTGSTSYLIDVVGSSFVSGATVQVGGTSLTTTFISPTELQAAFTAATGQSGYISVTVTNPNPGSSTTSSVSALLLQTTTAAAARFLDQTSFGPTAASIAQVQQLGLTAYLNQQLGTAPTLLPDIPVNPYPTQCLTASYPCAESEWWQAALTGNDQLRQRVAFALSEMWVTSSATVVGEGMTPYMNILTKDAFTNYRTIMQDVTLSPAMGLYLNMMNSNKPATGQIANENYPRELMQLFTLGLDLLNPDGTLQTDGSGNPIPTYAEADVQGFARAYTGWTFSNADGSAPTKFPNNTNAYDYPMQSVAANHDIGSKAILGGVTLPASQTAQQDLQASLDDIFNHPNIGPFVCKQLIQHLVSSNPSPEYVSRVAAVFANNGNGVRGDMKAVITAILMDTEARAADSNPAVDGGHLREPILYITDVLRGLGFTPTDANAGADYAYMSLSNYANNLSERPMRSGSVFNFFPPSYVIPGTTINAPEFGLENTASVILRLSLADSFVNNKISGFTVDLSSTSALGVTAASNPGQLVDTLAATLMHSQMPTAMRTDIVNQVTAVASSNPALRVRVAVYLIISSSGYKVIS